MLHLKSLDRINKERDRLIRARAELVKSREHQRFGRKLADFVDDVPWFMPMPGGPGAKILTKAVLKMAFKTPGNLIDDKIADTTKQIEQNAEQISELEIDEAFVLDLDKAINSESAREYENLMRMIEQFYPDRFERHEREKFERELENQTDPKKQYEDTIPGGGKPTGVA